jgi:hypothetical protein
MKIVATAIIVVASALTMTATSASAAIVCNEDGDCWNAKEKYEFRPEVRLHVYPDEWKWRESDARRYRWREHDGHGYWRGGVWIDL